MNRQNYHYMSGGMPPNMPMNMMPTPIIPNIMQSNIYNNQGSFAGMPITPLATSANIMNLLNQTNLPTSGEFRKVYVGKIPPGVSDTFMLKLLETCGAVQSWKRGRDSTDRPKGFGFCEYHSVESMLKCLRLLNNLKLEDGYELTVRSLFFYLLQIKVDSKTEDFLKHWREEKKKEWLEGLKRRGAEINMDEIKKKEMKGEPLEWELQLISKDHETRKNIFDTLTQKNEIEMYARATEQRPEEYLKDIKDLTHNPYNLLNQHPESKRERERAERKQATKKKLEKQYLDEIKRWEKHEEDRERERLRSKQSEEDQLRRKKRLVERDLNYDSAEEKKKLKENPRRLEDVKHMRNKENEFDEMMRRKENPQMYAHENMNTIVTDLVPVESKNTQIKEDRPEDRELITFKEYVDDDEEQDINKAGVSAVPVVSLNIEKKLIKTHAMDVEEDDLFNKKELPVLDLDEEGFKDIDNEVKQSRKEEEDRKRQQQHIKDIVNKSNSNESTQKLIHLQKEIFESIPKEKDDLFKYPINWNLLTKVKYIT
jgi:RNA-binding protein 25